MDPLKMEITETLKKYNLNYQNMENVDHVPRKKRFVFTFS